MPQYVDMDGIQPYQPNPHKSEFGTGNYDVNVLQTAIQNQGYLVKWFDSRNDVNIINLEVIFGVLINYTERKFFGLRKTQHWCCIRNLHNSFVLFNSFQDQPEIFENETDVFLYFTTILSEKSGQILLVVEPDLEGYVYK
eukprot:TRINITY_DN567_c0_g1_i3.p1 TRINITY_DN567_c0_g1~~TRINITY_DN567_c0_g1_i3.p1  ORF type:complete len:140 (-),score=23.21 TRINITY_DN567_c0_g1_i3:29-448(-)